MFEPDSESAFTGNLDLVGLLLFLLLLDSKFVFPFDPVLLSTFETA